jgi:hypothetical protein
MSFLFYGCVCVWRVRRMCAGCDMHKQAGRASICCVTARLVVVVARSPRACPPCLTPLSGWAGPGPHVHHAAHHCHGLPLRGHGGHVRLPCLGIPTGLTPTRQDIEPHTLCTSPSAFSSLPPGCTHVCTYTTRACTIRARGPNSLGALRPPISRLVACIPMPSVRTTATATPCPR